MVQHLRFGERATTEVTGVLDVIDAPAPTQGFDEFLLTRNYLDRRYF